jgi:hypothetical protein
MRWLLLLALACAPSSRILERVEHPYRPGRRVDRMLVIVGGHPFETNAIRNGLEERAIEIDVVVVTSSYPTSEQWAEHLHDQLILPKRLEGYQKIFLLGIEDGSAAAAKVAQRYANEPDGLILIRPAPGLESWATGFQRCAVDTLPTTAAWTELLERDPFGWIKQY